jgi:hypothetical protein
MAYCIGSVFGAVQLFESILEPSHVPIDCADMITVTIDHGTVLRINMEEFYSSVLSKHTSRANTPATKPGTPAFLHAEAASTNRHGQSETELEEALTRDAIQSKAARALSPELYSFLSQIQLMPPPLNTVFNGSIGRSFDVTVDSDQLVYVVLEGSLRVDLKPNRRRQLGHSIAHTRTGSAATQFRTGSVMPVVRLDSGSILTFTESEFSIGAEQPSRSRAGRGDSQAAHEFVPYHYTVVFERPSIYLAIDVKNIRNLMAALHALDDSSK